jgi:hypothetical protein
MLALGLGLLTTGCIGDGPPGGGDDTGGGTDARSNHSGSRIKMNMLTTPDGARSFTGWRDTQLDLDCNFQLAGDGVMRCLPTTELFDNGVGYFGDAACSIPVAIRSSCFGPEPKHILRYPSPTCPITTGYRVHAAGAKYTTTYARSGANCVATGLSFTAYAIGAEVAPSTFQSATSSVE